MGIVHRFGLCSDIFQCAKSFFVTIQSHPVTQYIISGIMFINYYTQHFYQKANIYGRELYYNYVDTSATYENLSIQKREEHDVEIDTMYYSNFKTNQYLMLKSNTFTFTDHSIQDTVTKEFLQTMFQYKNPILSAILAIKDTLNNREFSIEVNKILEPFIFPGNTINGNKNFLLYLIHSYYNKNNDKSETCIALEDVDNLKDFSISLSYITFNEVGLTTIPEMCNTEWKLSITNENKVNLEIYENNE